MEPGEQGSGCDMCSWEVLLTSRGFWNFIWPSNSMWQTGWSGSICDGSFNWAEEAPELEVTEKGPGMQLSRSHTELQHCCQTLVCPPPFPYLCWLFDIHGAKWRFPALMARQPLTCYFRAGEGPGKLTSFLPHHLWALLVLGWLRKAPIALWGFDYVCVWWQARPSQWFKLLCQHSLSGESFSLSCDVGSAYTLGCRDSEVCTGVWVSYLEWAVTAPGTSLALSVPQLLFLICEVTTALARTWWRIKNNLYFIAKGLKKSHF